jgi:pimeloyl-ACP methyl ester carboxylesterase
MSPWAHASDLAKEKRWASQVVDAIMDGDAEWLNDGSNNFLSIYTEAVEDKGHAVIVMHGTGIHPDWQQVVQPLRVGLTEHDWNTLAIQMPVLANDAEYAAYAPLYPEVAPRIDAAIAYLKEQGNEKIVLLGHSQGAVMGAYYLREPRPDVNGFVAVGMGNLSSHDNMNSVMSLEKIKVPVLDLYGTDDLDEVLSFSDERAAAAKKAGNDAYVQKKITGNHFFDGHEGSLVEAVAEWLDSL